MPTWRRRQSKKRRKQLTQETDSTAVLAEQLRRETGLRKKAHTWRCTCPRTHPWNRHRCKKCSTKIPVELRAAYKHGIQKVIFHSANIQFIDQAFEDSDLAGYTKPGWYWWDETHTSCYGPHATPVAAAMAKEGYSPTGRKLRVAGGLGSHNFSRISMGTKIAGILVTPADDTPTVAAKDADAVASGRPLHFTAGTYVLNTISLSADVVSDPGVWLRPAPGHTITLNGRIITAPVHREVIQADYSRMEERVMQQIRRDQELCNEKQRDH